MKTVLVLTGILASFLFLTPFLVLADNKEQTEIIRSKLEIAKNRMAVIDIFQGEIHSTYAKREKKYTASLTMDLMQFDVKVVEVGLQLAITEAVFMRSLSEDIGTDPFLEMIEYLIKESGKSRIQYVEEMIVIIENGLETLEIQKKRLEKIL